MTDQIQVDLTKVYCHTASGKLFYPYALTPDQIDIETIAQHLACQCRWNGAPRHRFIPNRIFYSVAEHSVYVADYVAKELGRPDLAFDALMHDAAEAYIPDLIRPLKYSAEFSAPFRKLENIIEGVIAQKYRLQTPMPKEIKHADDAVCYAEWQQVIPKGPAHTLYTVPEGVEAASIGIAMLSPIEARDLFLQRFYALVGAHWDKYAA